MDESFLSTITRRRPIRPISFEIDTAEKSSRPLLSGVCTKKSTTTSTTNSTRSSSSPSSLKRSLSLIDLIFYGVGCSVGAGIYSLVGIGANLAGPSIALSFLLCGVACCFTSLSYGEFASRVPLAGSAYTFTYVTFGEICGWLVGWNLTLGYAVSAAVVARSWAQYVVGFLEGITWIGEKAHHVLALSVNLPIPILGSDYTCSPLAMVIVGVCTLILVTGAKESTRFNTAMTVLNLSILGFVVLAGVTSGTIENDNLTPVFPHGVAGMARGAGLVFFSYLGFDMCACLGEEVREPAKNLPRGIVGSLLVSMSIYVSVSIVVVGMAPISLLGEDVPIVNALLGNACCSHTDQLEDSSQQNCLSYDCSPVLRPVLFVGSRLVSFGAIFGLTTATFACLMGQPRIFYSMAQDGLLFKIYARVHPKTGVPTIGTILTGIATALVACLVDLEALANAISLGTLQVFTFVNAGVIVLRMQPPHISQSSSRASLVLEESVVEEDSTHEEFSPLIRGDPQAALLARSLGLVKQTSHEIRDSIRTSLVLPPPSNVRDNGCKPHVFTSLFVMCTLLASIGISNHWHWGSLVWFAGIDMVCAWQLMRLPQARPPETFNCPFVPFVPLMGCLCNCYMMGSMPLSTWSVIAIWLLIGLVFYFSYGIYHSELRGKVNRRSSRSSSVDDSHIDSKGRNDDSITTNLIPLQQKKGINYDSIQIPHSSSAES